MILIAVALFAALSYAITTSGRGSGTVSKEKSELDLAGFSSYMGDINAAVQRMVVTGTDPATIQFYTAWNSYTPCTSGTACVFSPQGGGVVYRDITKFFPVVYNVHFYRLGDKGFAKGIGSDSNDDIMMIVDGIADDICTKINQKYNIASPLQPHAAFNPNDGSVNMFDAFPGEFAFCFDDEYPTPTPVANGVYVHVFYGR